MKRVIASAILSASLLPVAAIAQDVVDDGAYVRVGAGATFVNDWNQIYTFAPDPVGSLFCPSGGACAAVLVAPPSGQNVANGNGLVAAIAIGFDYADGIRTELEYRYARSDINAIAVADSTVQPFPPTLRAEDDINAHFVMSNFYFDFYNDSRFTPFIGGGVGGAFVENEFGNRDAALALQGRAGVSIDLGDGLSADFEYIYLRTNELSFGPRTETFPAGDFDIVTDGDRYKSSSTTISFRKKF